MTSLHHSQGVDKHLFESKNTDKIFSFRNNTFCIEAPYLIYLRKISGGKNPPRNIVLFPFVFNSLLLAEEHQNNILSNLTCIAKVMTNDYACPPHLELGMCWEGGRMGYTWLWIADSWKYYTLSQVLAG